MLTKQLKFDEETLDVLRAMIWSADGTLGTITGGQLERALYTKVNKALDAMGGKWNRGKGGHIFATDPRPQVEGLLENGALTVERDGFFETPPAVTKRMFELAPVGRASMLILEPSAGMGAIVKMILATPYADNHSIMVCEKNEARRETLARSYKCSVVGSDFLQYELPRYSDQDHEQMFQYQRIYMNPPFEEGQDIEHVRHAYDLLQPGVGIMVSVMGEGAFFRGDKKAVAFRKWLELVGGTSEPLPNGSFKESGTGVNTRLVVISK